VPTYQVDRARLDVGVPVVELLTTDTQAFPSKGELRRTIKGNGLSLNQAKLTDQEYLVTGADLINGSYILVQKGKKNYYIIEAVWNGAVRKPMGLAWQEGLPGRRFSSPQGGVVRALLFD
jgi:hypothetical protein